MNKAKKKAVIIETTILIAVLADVVLKAQGVYGDSNMHSYIRSIGYIAIVAAWLISIRVRIIQPQSKRYLTCVSGFMVFSWLCVLLNFIWWKAWL